MNLLGTRVISGSSLRKSIKEYKKQNHVILKEEYFYHRFFTKKEKKYLNPVYMTIYVNEKGKQYVRFTNHIPSPSGIHFTRLEDLIGVTTGYNTTIVSCEKCYIIG